VKKPAKGFLFPYIKYPDIINPFNSPLQGTAMSTIFSDHKSPYNDKDDVYHFLLPRHIQMIDEALCSLGEYGEVRLVVEKGQLRFLVTQKSYDTLKWHPGILVKELDA